MSKAILTFEGYKQARLREKHRKQREEEVAKIVPPKPVEGEPVNPDLSISTSEV